VGDVGQLPLQLERFVIASPGFRPVAAADDHDPQATLTKPLADPADHRRLACTARGEISNADHRRGYATNSEVTAIVARVAPPSSRRVRYLSTKKDSLPQTRGEPAPATTDDIEKIGLFKQDREPESQTSELYGVRKSRTNRVVAARLWNSPSVRFCEDHKGEAPTEAEPSVEPVWIGSAGASCFQGRRGFLRNSETSRPTHCPSERELHPM
jgi:hypothetical protein